VTIPRTYFRPSKGVGVESNLEGIRVVEFRLDSDEHHIRFFFKIIAWYHLEGFLQYIYHCWYQ